MRARYKVSTHSRSKAAANKNVSQLLLLKFQHTAARRRLPLSKLNRGELNDVSTHSRPKAAAFVAANFACVEVVSTHSRPKAAASTPKDKVVSDIMFQHTAARRRLLDTVGVPMLMLIVSTHSRPKAAALITNLPMRVVPVSTHSRPKAAAPYIKR